jgi:glycosyltransferase involved in cell wall biosynthesis
VPLRRAGLALDATKAQLTLFDGSKGREMAKKFNVLMVAPSGGVYGGVEVYTATIAKEVIEGGGFDVRVVYRIPKGTALQDTMKRGLSKFGVSWRVIRCPDLQYLRDLLWADVIHCHFPLVYATFPARLLGKKLFVTVEAKRNLVEHGFKFWFGLNLAHAQWYISKFVAETWGKTTFDENCKIVPATSDLPTAYVPPSSRKGFFFIARWVPFKGLEQLVEAYATARIDRNDHPLFLFGDGPLRQHIERLVDHWKIRNFVEMPGFVMAAEKEAQMSSAKWNLAPVAFAEDLGLTPIEARCCGVPSIVSRAGGVPEGAGDQALFCDPGSVNSLKAALERASSMSDEEYNKRSDLCKRSLESYLPPTGFYQKEYMRVLES